MTTNVSGDQALRLPEIADQSRDHGANRIGALEGLRGIAVILVFNVHLFARFVESNYTFGEYPWIARFLACLHAGHIGVDLFFILSGFFIFKTLQRSPKFIPFMYNRYARILPVIVIAAIPRFLEDDIRFSLRLLIENIFFIKISDAPYLNYVTWSLTYEIAFYILIGLLVAALGIARVRNFAMLAGISLLVWLTQFIGVLPGLHEVNRFIGFFLGIAICILNDNRTFEKYPRTSSHLWIPGVFIFALVSYLWSKLSLAQSVQDDVYVSLMFYLAVQIGFSLLIVSALSPISLIQRFLNGKKLRRLGQISFSFYMVHELYGLTLIDKWFALPRDKTWALFLNYILAFSLAFFIASILYRYLERPYFTNRASKSSR